MPIGRIISFTVSPAWKIELIFSVPNPQYLKKISHQKLKITPIVSHSLDVRRKLSINCAIMKSNSSVRRNRKI
jgi:hypothetical protein